MFRKNLASQYKVYARNLKILKDKIAQNDGKSVRKLKNDSNSPEYLKFIQQKAFDTSQQVQKATQDVHGRLKEALTLLSVTTNKKVDQKFLQEQTQASCSGRLQKILDTLKQRQVLLASAAVTVAEVQSTETTNVQEAAASVAPTITLEPIPEPPPIPDSSTFVDLTTQLNALGEPTFAALGLGGWTPVGFVQSCLEYFHVDLGLPWWQAIALGTVIIRFLLFPLVVMAQRNAAKMNNYLPQLQTLQLKMTEARQTGNQIEAARYSQEMMLFMKEKNLNPLKNMIVPLAQMPVFISFFMGLRKMANLPVDSLREGGIFWFTDLTVPDQFFALPIITSLTLWATIELGTDTAKLSSQNLNTMKYVLRALPLIIFPFTVNFPGAVLCYWVSSNFISLAQVGFLKIPAVRDYFNIEPLVKHDPQNLPLKSKGFVGGVKDSWTNMKITRELEERKNYDSLQFQRAGRGPVVKTYKYDPTKQADNPNAISAKKR